MKSDSRESNLETKLNGDAPVWRRLIAQVMRGLSDLLEASEPRRKRPRNLYIRGMSSHGLVTKPYSE